MKTICNIFVVLLVFVITVPAIGQVSPSERKVFNEYTSADELVSISPSTPMDRALMAIGEVSKRFINKIIVDTERRSMPINIDIQAMPWRDALEAICRKNGIWYAEYESYLQLTGGTTGTEATAVKGKVEGIQKESATFRSREIKITAVFFEVNLTKLDEVGINWNFMKSTNDVAVASTFGGADRVSSEIFETDITPKVSFANINLVARMFSNYDLGEVLSGPQLIVRSGEEGRIQVGQDFSIKERDFAGNLIDKFYSAGTIINVKPQVINEQGVNFVHLDVDVERSSVVPGAVSTIINKTKANTNLLLLDGEETIIGGLYNNEASTVRTGVPFLKDLPWYVFGLRYLFGYNREEIKKKELIILLKAELLPTLQERITQKKEDKYFERWLEERNAEEQRVRPEPNNSNR
ncbi:MAG: type II secretion system protein GspD [Bacteroidota bacterium]